MAQIIAEVSDSLKHSIDNISNVNWNAVIENSIQEKINDLYIQKMIEIAQKESIEGKCKSHEEVKAMFLDKNE